MKSASIQDLRIHTLEVVRAAQAGATIIIERRGVPVAELGPLSKQAERPALPDLTEVWIRMPQVQTDSGRFLEEGR